MQPSIFYKQNILQLFPPCATNIYEYWNIPPRLTNQVASF
jgi:hypothetical protein